MKKGMLDLESLTQAVADGTIDTVIVAFTDHYGRLMGKRCDADFFVDEIATNGTHGCDYLLTVDIDMEPIEGFAYANWERGYGDFHLVPDMQTLRRAAWAERTALVLCDVHSPEHDLVAVAPRSILRRQIDRAHALGFSAKAASELEFFIFEQTYHDAARSDHHGLTRAGWYNEDYDLLHGGRHEPYVGAARRMLRASGIPVETSKGEAAQGQHELNIRFADVGSMSDRHTVMKHAMKALADRHDCSITFMAKPIEAEPGSSCHIHLSLWDGDGAANVFSTEADEQSDEFRWFLGGWMRHLPELMALFAPTINSYKRFVAESWAPTRNAWSLDNRTAGFRIVGTGAARRIECRIAGGDANPYLAYSAALAAGLDGIENRIEPPPMLSGNAYDSAEEADLPPTLRDAVRAFEASTFARSAFGDEVVDHYVHWWRSEIAAFDSAVTDWEVRRYFERI